MKIFFKTLVIVLFILINMNRIQTQTPETKLDQVELMKKFIGTWKGEFGDNSVFMCENKKFANGIISTSHITTNGKINAELTSFTQTSPPQVHLQKIFPYL